MSLVRIANIFLFIGLASIVGKAAQVTLGLQSAVKASGVHSAITPEFSASVERYLADNGVPGLSVGVVYVNGSTVETEFGTWGNRTEDGDLMSKETLFYIGSCSKAFMSASIGILMDDFVNGKNVTTLPSHVEEFTWTTKLHELLPDEWKLKDAWASEKANIRDILSHVSGLPRHDLAYGSRDAPADVVKKLQMLEPAFELREQYYYNNHMYVLGAYIVAKYSGMSFNAYVNEHIIKPLNMTSTVHVLKTFHLTDSYKSAFTLLAGVGGIILNTVDMTKWLAMLLNGGVNPYTNQIVVPKDVIEAVTTAYTITAGQGPDRDMSIGGYGMGWGRHTYKGHEVVEHGGGLPGFLTETRFLPWDNFGVNVLMSNDFAREVPPTVAQHLIDRVLGLPHSEPNKMDLTSKAIAGSVSSVHKDKITGKPALSLSMYEGLYTHPAYGPLVLCSSANPSSYCSDILAEFSSVNATSRPALYASWDRIWTKHVQLFPHSGHEFELDSFTIFPHGFGRDERPFTATLLRNASVQVIFDVQDGQVKGLALPDGFESEPVVSAKRKGSLKESAFVYYDRV